MRSLKLIFYDFDGVMTDNRALLMEDGREAVFVNRADGFAVAKIKDMGIEQIIISTEDNPVVSIRGNKLGIFVMQSMKDKKSAVEVLLREKKISPECVAFVGNDINDEGAMGIVGWPIAPADAHVSIKKIARLVLSAKGGGGIVREILDHLTRGNI